MRNWVTDFSQLVDYSRSDDICVEVFLASGSSSFISVPAKVDTGSKHCIFQPRYAVDLGLELESGIRQSIRTATGTFIAYGHDLLLTIGELEWDAFVYFAEPAGFPVNVVGRLGFLDRLEVGLVEYDHKLYLRPYQPD
jgi:hypothetical protein